MKNKKGFILPIVIVAVVVVIVGTAGYFGYRYYSETKEELEKSVITDETAGLKTYRNEEYGFEVKYPPDFFIDENPDYPYSGGIIVTFRPSSYGDFSFHVGGPFLKPDSTKLGELRTFEEELELHRKYSDIESRKDFKEKSITVSGIDSKEFSYFDEDWRKPGEYIKFSEVVIPLDNNKFLSVGWKSRYYLSRNQAVDSNEDQFYRILSTFKLIELPKVENLGQVVCTQDAKQCPDGSYVGRTGPNCEFAECPISKDETADWKTYRNEEYGFEIKYPNYLQIKVRGRGELGDASLVSVDIDENPQDNIYAPVLVRLTREGPDFRIGTRDWIDYNIGQIDGSIACQYGSCEILFGGIGKQDFYIKTEKNPRTDIVTGQILSTFKFIEE